jgi:type II secretory pathway component PulC
MFRNYFLINLLLIVITVFLGIKLYKVLAYSIDIPTEPSEKKIEKKIKVKHKDKALKEASFEIISKQDLFRPSRLAPQKDEGKTERASPINPPRLFGTIILHDEKTAILEDPDTKLTKTYRINDSVAGFVISEIMEDKVVLLRDGERSEVRLRGEKKGIVSKRKSPTRRTPRSVQSRRTSRPSKSVPRRSRTRRTITPEAPEAPEAPVDEPYMPENMDN